MANIELSSGLIKDTLKAGFGNGDTVYIAIKTSSGTAFEAKPVKFDVSGANFIRTNAPVTFSVNAGVTVSEVRIAATAQGAEMEGEDVMASFILSGDDEKSFAQAGAYVIASITITGG